MTPAPCPLCAFADAHGWWGREGTHCRGCHRTWAAFGQAHCATCHNHFSTPTAFDRHLAPRGCLDPSEVRTKDGTPRLILRDGPSGPLWGWPDSRAGRDFRAAKAPRGTSAHQGPSGAPGAPVAPLAD
jgi:hypothetical protein